MTTALSLSVGAMPAFMDTAATDRILSEHGLLDGLLEDYALLRHRIRHLSELMGKETPALAFFLQGYDSHYGRLNVEDLFAEDKAVAALNSDFWSRTLALTDVMDCMPQKRRDEWNKAIHSRTAPEFTLDSVRPTIATLLAARAQFLAERIDGLFRALSGSHVTNSPAGFNARMILSYVVDKYEFINSSKAGYITDLRKVIAKFMGRDEPRWDASQHVIKICRETPGQWFSIDGGALRMRVYKAGTAHLEVHPEMAWRLNAMLAQLYPKAIPANERTAPRKPSKKHPLIEQPLPFAVLSLLGDCRQQGKNEIRLPIGRLHAEKEAAKGLRELIEGIGGVYVDQWTARFDYDPVPAIAHVMTSGRIPERQSDQFYATPRAIALELVRRAEIDEACSCLEPSAGQGAIAELLPKDRTVCVEVSGLHSEVLRAKGYAVVQADFLAWANRRSAPTFSRVLMNPPFSDGRARAHVEAAAQLVEPGGRLCAVLPASLRGVDMLPGWAGEWSQVYRDEFQGTGAAVVIYAARRESAGEMK